LCFFLRDFWIVPLAEVGRKKSRQRLSGASSAGVRLLGALLEGYLGGIPNSPTSLSVSPAGYANDHAFCVDSAEIGLVNLPISPRQSRISFFVAIVLIAGLGATAPFADVQLPRIDAFIPAAEIAVIITDFITAALLFSQARMHLQARRISYEVFGSCN
jgi:hypothetical protein